ncbi:hypothetical protein [Haloarcula argentinensis]|uniref:Uncharacterized protein n=1 Tax=Haloarcula argentinensis TaxID=43776 RepID=A0A847UP34_HALAR|nr:hypothetical protein [Haloarcula argentinensis]NLV14356.1 hypothetical protein [Haloarcula argentinensis]
MSSEPDSGERYGEYVQRQTSRQQSYSRQNTLKEGVKNANEHLAKGRHYEAACILRDVVLPTIHELESAKPMSVYHAEIGTDDDLPWYWSALKRFKDQPHAYCRAVAAGNATTVLDGDTRRVTQTIRRAVASAESIVAHHDITESSMKNRVDAVGFSSKLGEHLQDPEMDFGDPVRAVAEQAGALKTLFCGGTGMGKSTGVEREAEDYYLTNWQEGRDFKLIDLVGLRDGENWFYDIPQQQDDLRRIREEQGLAPDFAEVAETSDRDIEILAPLTPDLTQQEMPFDEDDEEFIVKPFTVPASELSKPLLVSLIMSRLSEGEEQTIRGVYDDVDATQDDWALADLADHIRSRDELGEKHKAKAIGVLRSLQQEGFIRTHDDENTLEWREIFKSTETVTVFTQAFCRNKISRLVTFAYLINAIQREREQMIGIPQCVLLARELWKVCPHKQRQSFDARSAALQEAIGQMLAEIFRENRHSGIHLLADTQQPSDLLKPVREMFNRYVIYSANKDTIKDIFSWTQNNRWDSFWSTMTAKSGEAGVIGQVEPAIEERDVEFLSPIAYAPPSHHHRDAETDLTGWHARCKYLDNEELATPMSKGIRWEDYVPDHLEITPVSTHEDGPDPQTQPVAAFVNECIAYTSEGSEKRTDVRTAFNEFVKAKGRSENGWDFDDNGVMVRFGDQFKTAVDGEVRRTTKRGDNAYGNIVLNEVGKSHLESAMDGLEDAAKPLADAD